MADSKQIYNPGPREPHVRPGTLQASRPPQDSPSQLRRTTTITQPRPEDFARQVRQRRRRQNCLGTSLAIGAALLAFCCVASIAAAVILPSAYRAQRPEQQAIWCSRASTLGASFVCDWKPTPPFEVLPTLSNQNNDGQPTLDPFLILTPATATPTQGATEGSLLASPTPSTGAAVFVTATPTPSPSPTVFVPTFTPTPSPTAAPTQIPVPSSYKLDLARVTYHAQMWNNCGPATLSMALSFFGYRNHQEVAARYLKPNGEDKNVSPYQMVNYVNQQVTDVSVNALTRIGGDMHLLKVLLANNFPVIIEKGYEVDDLDWMGHYLLLVGYDDALQVFYSYDSYLGHGNSQGLQESYSDVAYYWKHFNQTFIVLYEPWQQAQVLALLGSRAEPFTAAQQALDIAKTQVQFNSQDNWAWFNIGSAYTELGDYERAAQAFDQAFILGMPWRTLWYLHQPYQAYLAVGRYDDILAHTQATERTTVYVEETFYYRGAVLALAGNTQGANEAFSQALTYNRNFEPARLAREALQNGSFNKSLILNVGYGG